MKESQTTPRIDMPLLFKRKALLLDIASKTDESVFPISTTGRYCRLYCYWP